MGHESGQNCVYAVMWEDQEMDVRSRFSWILLEIASRLRMAFYLTVGGKTVLYVKTWVSPKKGWDIRVINHTCGYDPEQALCVVISAPTAVNDGMGFFSTDDCLHWRHSQGSLIIFLVLTLV